MMNFIHTFNEICWFITFLIGITVLVYSGISALKIFCKDYKEFKKLKNDGIVIEKEHHFKWGEDNPVWPNEYKE